MMDTNGGVFGDSGGTGLGAVLPPNIEDEGFEDLGGPVAMGAPGLGAQMPGVAQGMPMHPGMPRNVPGAVAVPQPMRMAAAGLGQEPMQMVATETCSKWGSRLGGFAAGLLTAGLAVGTYHLLTRE
jgi:hypothetical protein